MENYDVLIVDDDTDINNMVSDALKKSGYTSMQAFSGTEGIFAVKMYKFKIITKTSHTQNELSTLKTQYYSETNMKFRQQQAF